MSPEPTKTQTSLAISIRTMGQDLGAIQKGQTPTPRVETVVAGPPETLPVEQLARSPRPMPQPTPAPRPTIQPTPPKPAAPSQLESVLAPKTQLPKPLIASVQAVPKPTPLTPVPQPHPAPPRPPTPTLPPPKPTTPPPTPAVSSILKARIQADLQEATKRQDAMVTSVLRLLISAIHNAEIAQHKETTGLDDNEIRGVIASEVQRRKEAIAGYERGSRGELTEKERTELAVLYHYLPTPPVPPAGPRPPTAPLTQPVKPAFSPPAQPPPHPIIPPPPLTPPVAPPASKVPVPTPAATPARLQPPAAGANRRKLVFLASSLAVIVLAAAGGTLWWFKFRPTPAPPPPPITEPTPPTPILRAPITQTVETPTVGGIHEAIARVWAAPGTPGTPVAILVKITPAAGETPKRYATKDELVNAISITFPSALASVVTDLSLIWYTQNEIFSAAVPAVADRNRFALAIRLNATAEAARQYLTAWETTTMSRDLEPYLQLSRLGADRAFSPFGWQDTTYRAVPIRYINYTLPDQSIDYAFLPAQNLLLITTSRESMYALVDLVLMPNSN